jgi:lipid II:glycine glycyltransferase (peptidoglycan interpeptide bridge formation enzyme)
LNSRHWLEDLLPSDLENCNSSSNFLQSGFWGSFKARFGWNARSFEVVWKQGRHPLMVIRRRLSPGLSFAYVPWGPDLPEAFPADDEARTVALAELAEALKAFLPKDTAFIRFDPPWYSEGADVPAPKLGLPFIHATTDVQAPDTVLVSLEGTKETLLAKMKNKWRYNSRLALKRGVIIRRPDEKGLDDFYSLLKETARRDRIFIHDVNYYKTLFTHCSEYQKKSGSGNISLPSGIVPSIHLYTAEYEAEILAAIVVLFRGREAVYLYGASSNNKRNLMAPYALQVRAMLDAMEAGCKEYDLFGIPPSEDLHHPMAGLYRFKTGFGGRVIHRPGSWDYSYRPLAMKAFSFMESMRKKLRNISKGARTEAQKDPE